MVVFVGCWRRFLLWIFGGVFVCMWGSGAAPVCVVDI